MKLFSRDSRPEDAIYSEQLKLLFSAIPLSLFGNLFNATILVVVLWSVIPHPLLVGWLAALVLVSLARYLHFRYYRKETQQQHDIDLAACEKHFIFGSTTSALLWGLVPIFLYPEYLAYQAIIAFVIGGMSAGAVSSLSFRLLASRLYLLVVLIPLIIRLFSSGSFNLVLMGLMVVMFLVLLMVSANRIYKNTEQNIQLRLSSDKREQELQDNIKALQDFHTITSSIDTSFDNKLHRLLQHGLATFGMDIGIISHIDHGVYTVEHIIGPPGTPEPGTKFNFADTYCSQTYFSNKARGFHHVADSELASHPCYQSFRLEAYIGVTIWQGLERYGTLNFSSPTPRATPFSEHEIALIQLFAQWIGNEMARNESEKKLSQFKTTLDMTKDCVFMFDPNSLRFFYVNQGAIEQVGYSYKELLSMTPVDLKPDYDTTSFARLLQPLIDGEKSMLHFETTHRHKNGSELPVEISLQYVTPPNTLPRFIALVRDISERRRVDEMKNEFVSTVSHELRTPLTSIRGALGLISSGACGEVPERMQSMLNIASNNTQRLLLLINDLLDLQKIESGNLDFHFIPTAVMPFVEQAMNDSLGYAREHNVRIRLIEGIREGAILADTQRLMQVMNNLLSNAIKFSPENDEVQIAVTRIAGYIRITITDHGPGIPETFHDELFERFTQFDSSDTRKAGGTGLGLAICKLIVEKHNGHIDFTSTLGEGSSFFIELEEQYSAT